MRTRLPAHIKACTWEKVGNFRGYFKHAYTGVLDRGVPVRGRARNERAAAVGFSEESLVLHAVSYIQYAALCRFRECACFQYHAVVKPNAL